MNKRTIRLLIISAIAAVALIIIILGLKNIKIDEFHPASVIFVIDSSASNQQKLSEQVKVLKNLCSRLDPEDKVKIIRVSEDAYLIYEGYAHSTAAITKSINEFTQYQQKDYGTAYGDGMKKALNHALTQNREGYVPAIVVIGDLENEGNAAKQINWSKLPAEVRTAKADAPNLVLMFLYAHPQKLDMVKELLSPVMGETDLIVATEQNTDNAIKSFITAIGR